jgi:serine phosphatase RsbU (regulator of sigma subunit)
MRELEERISRALAKEEARAERFANNIRTILLVVLTVIVLLNAPSVTLEANMLNGGALLIGYSYGLIVLISIRRMGYHPVMKYITSCLDLVLVFLLLFLYTMIEIPSVALKHYVFLVVFPLVALTAFRYDRTLIFTAGGLTVALYLALLCYLSSSNLITLTHGGYERELFSSDVTYIGQLTKMLIFTGYALLLSYFAQYTRTLFAKLVSHELSSRNQREIADGELKIASEVQTRFLPHAFPTISGLEMYGEVHQGRHVGGDYYDFIKLADDRLLVITADVSGNGVPAGLIMAEVRASTHLLASMHIELQELVQRLNSLVYQSTDKRKFVSYFAAEIDTSRQTIAYINAGHPPPVICVGGMVRTLAKGTIPLGLCDSLPLLTMHTEAFLPGSVLVTYTDGLTEHTNQKEDEYGDERFRTFVQTHCRLDAHSFTSTFLDEIRTFGEGKALNDDVGLTMVKSLSASRQSSIVHSDS